MTQVTINNITKEVECDALKLARTLWNKEGDKYSEEEMNKMGFERK